MRTDCIKLLLVGGLRPFLEFSPNFETRLEVSLSRAGDDRSNFVSFRLPSLTYMSRHGSAAVQLQRYYCQCNYVSAPSPSWPAWWKVESHIRRQVRMCAQTFVRWQSAPQLPYFCCTHAWIVTKHLLVYCRSTHAAPSLFKSHTAFITSKEKSRILVRTQNSNSGSTSEVSKLDWWTLITWGLSGTS